MENATNRSLQILVVDDDKIQNKLMSVYLSKLQVENVTEYALTIDDAVGAITARRPDVIFLDNRIPPDIDFRQGLERIRSAGFDGPVIVHSVTVDDAVLDEARAYGVMRVVDKFDLKEGVLEDLVAVCWSRKFSGTAVESRYMNV